ncbi:hypothetical protein A2U01_0105174, partial [Trifolium medium]|nr:hypothetical protein [Trifolium medium]
VAVELPREEAPRSVLDEVGLKPVEEQDCELLEMALRTVAVLK